MDKVKEITYNWANSVELEKALQEIYGKSYSLVASDSLDITPSILCFKSGEIIGSMFLTEPLYRIKMYKTHIVFDPQVHYVKHK